uniref:Uncharacterized protein MANES_S075500 n=1 Tax=Rhizophora mucronata TaxID=61149 RepID=A0A2P2JA14_RHIMU
MATFASSLSSSLLPSLLFRHRLHCRSNALPLSIAPLRWTITAKPRELRTVVLASSDSASASDGLFRPIANRVSCSPDKKTVLSDLIQEIEPLDVSLIQKDVPPTTLDAMKRTISGMLGLLPSDRFQVSIEALWEPLSKLLVSSMMTGYTLQNAEYRLWLERNLDMDEGNLAKQESDSKSSFRETSVDNARQHDFSGKNVKSNKMTDNPSDSIAVQGLGEMTPEAQQYILHLQSQLSSVKKELHEVKRKTAALQMQQFVGEEKNDLLDYLRSLQPEKVLFKSQSIYAHFRCKSSS